METKNILFALSPSDLKKSDVGTVEKEMLTILEYPRTEQNKTFNFF